MIVYSIDLDISYNQDVGLDMIDINISISYFSNIQDCLQNIKIQQFYQMTDILTPDRSPPNSNRIKIRPKSQQGIRNYSNVNLHAGLDIVKVYSGKVNQHLLRSQFENHSLQTACRPYNKQIQTNNNPSKMIRSQSNGSKINRVQSALLLNRNKSDIQSPLKKKSNIHTINLQKYKNKRNPQQQNAESVIIPQNKSNVYAQYKEGDYQKQNNAQISKNFAYKAEIIPQYSEELQEVWTYQQQLEETIKKLKTLIVSERNRKAKVSLSCNKIMNQCQNQQRNRRIKQQQNFNLNIMIDAIQKQNDYIRQQIQIANFKLKETVKKREQQKKQCQQLQSFVNQTRMVLMGQSKSVSKLKSKVSQSFNNMSNNYINVNLLKGEKALLLTDIRQNYYKNI